MKLIIPKPINVSLQSKLSTVVDNTTVLQEGAWDIIYFCRIQNGTQSGDVHRLGKCVNIEDNATRSAELLDNNTFANTDSWQFNNNDWSIDTINGTISYFSTGSDPLYQDITGLVFGKTYEVIFTISAITAGGVQVKVGDTGDGTVRTSAGTYTENIVAAGSNKTFYIQQNSTASGITIDSVYLKEVISNNMGFNNTYTVTVEPDATAQTPSSGDFIFFGKDNKVGIAGVTGYHATIEMKNDSIEYAELFSVSSEVTESSK